MNFLCKDLSVATGWKEAEALQVRRGVVSLCASVLQRSKGKEKKHKQGSYRVGASSCRYVVSLIYKFCANVIRLSLWPTHMICVQSVEVEKLIIPQSLRGCCVMFVGRSGIWSAVGGGVNRKRGYGAVVTVPLLNSCVHSFWYCRSICTSFLSSEWNLRELIIKSRENTSTHVAH